MPVKVSFDPAKDVVNIAKHGLSLADFSGFDSVAADGVDDRRDYGEVRYRAFGRIDGAAFSIGYTIRPEGVRLISFRRAHAREMRRYE